jgi:AmiR/NasT family two-component response regulator
VFHTDEEVIEALGPHETIGQAVSLLCAEHDVGEEDAFEMLVQGSADSNERVRKVAASIVRQSTGAHDNM